MHCMLLAVVLGIVLLVTNTGQLVSADEGALLSQVKILSDTGEWGAVNPSPTIDPEGTWFPLDLTEQVDGRFFPFAKRPVYAAVSFLAYEVGGLRGVLSLSTIGTWCAAVLGALIARRLRPGTERAVLWFVALGTPLFFDSFWAIGHSLSAAFATLAIYGLVRAKQDRALLPLLSVLVGVVGAALLRSEGVLFGLALAGGVLVCPSRTLSWKQRLVGVGIAGATVATYKFDTLLHRLAVGSGSVKDFKMIDPETDWLTGRFIGFGNSVLRPQLLGTPARGLVVLAAVCSLLAAGIYLRKRPTESLMICVGSIIAAACALSVLVLWRMLPIPGLLPAGVLLFVGLGFLKRTDVKDASAAMILTTAVLYVGAVLATQYSEGGSMEWGGRYFHLVIPAVATFSVIGLARSARTGGEAAAQREGSAQKEGATPVASRRTIAVWITACSVVAFSWLALAIGSYDTLHIGQAEVTAAVDALLDTSDPGDGGAPVLVSNVGAFGRFDWRNSLSGRQLRATDGVALPELDQRLRDAGIQEFIFAYGIGFGGEVGDFESYELGAEIPRTVGGYRLYVLHLRGE